MKFGDQVIYVENGKEFNATVLSARVLDNHMGAGDEPLVHLAFFKEVEDFSVLPDADNERPKISVLGTARQLELVQFRADVAHESHEFSGEARAQSVKPGNVPLPEGVYPGGRWREVDAFAASTLLSIPGVETAGTVLKRPIQQDMLVGETLFTSGSATIGDIIQHAANNADAAKNAGVIPGNSAIQGTGEDLGKGTSTAPLSEADEAILAKAKPPKKHKKVPPAIQ